MGAGASDTIECLALLNVVNGLCQSGVGFGALGELFALQLSVEVPHLVVHGFMEVHMAREDLLPPDVVRALVEKGIKCSFFPPVILPGNPLVLLRDLIGPDHLDPGTVALPWE